jgi:hypothetical protein
LQALTAPEKIRAKRPQHPTQCQEVEQRFFPLVGVVSEGIVRGRPGSAPSGSKRKYLAILPALLLAFAE